MVEIELEVGVRRGAALRHFGFRVPGNDILALDEVQTVLYTHLAITRFLYRSAGLNERQSLPKKAKVATVLKQWPTVVLTCPETLTHH